MKPAAAKIELPPSTQLQQAVFGSSLLLGKSFLGVLAICGVAILSPWIATPAEAGPEVNPAASARSATEYKLKIPFGLEETAVVIPADNPLTIKKIE